MAECKHTAGPFFVTRKFEVGPRSDAEDQTFGMVLPIADVFGDNKEADARLIAAAPDLLDALKAISRHIDSPATFSKYINDLCDAAISKAEGRSHD